jgi:E3 ubiquitin-protein ligase SIAH1
MESGDQRGKKPKIELPNGRVKQKVGAEETNGGGGGRAIVAAEAGGASRSRVDITINFDITLLQCPVCALPLKPPVFQVNSYLSSTLDRLDRRFVACIHLAAVVNYTGALLLIRLAQCNAEGHVACASCHGKLPGNRCHACDHGGVYGRCVAMDAVVRAARAPCPYDRHGCPSYLAYHDLGSHQSVCPYAPCSCTEPGCVFAGPPAALLGHLIGAHSWPVRSIRYGKVLRLRVPVSEPPRVLLVEEGDGRVFLLSGLVCRSVSLVCVRANEAAGPPYTCKLWADAPPDVATGKENSLLMDSTVTSSAAPGQVAMEEVMFLDVPPVMLHGAGASKEMLLRVRIDKSSSMP